MTHSRWIVAAWIACAAAGCQPPPEDPWLAWIGPEGGTVESEDGALTATIPAGALTVEREVSIVVANPATLPTTITDGGPVGKVYSLGPSDLTLALPVTFTWTFPASPTGARDTSGNPLVLIGHSYSSTGAIVPHTSTRSTIGADGSLTVVSETTQPGEQFLSASVYDGGWEPVGSVLVDLNGGMHAVDVPWSATTVQLQPAALSGGVMVQLPLFTTGPIEDLSDVDWQEVLGGGGFFGYGDTVTFTPGMPWSPTSLPSWACTAAGNGSVGLIFDVTIPITGPLDVEGMVSFTEPVTCYEREQKPEYTTEITTLGESRIAPLAVPGTAMANLADTASVFAYRVTVPPGATIRVCVTSSMPAGVTLYPQFPPGYTFVDVTPAGCTTVTNLDPVNPNVVLVKISGAGSPNNVTVTTSNEP